MHDYFYRYLHQIGTGKATGKQNQGFVEKFNEVEAAFDLFGFSKKVKKYFRHCIKIILFF